MTQTLIKCGNAGDNVVLTFKGGCSHELTYEDAYRCTGCDGRFHKNCIIRHFELEKDHDWGRLQERKAIEAKYGKRPVIPMGRGQPLLTHHFRGQLDNDDKFVYCPTGMIISWSEGDYDNKWCPWCKEYYV